MSHIHNATLYEALKNGFMTGDSAGVVPGSATYSTTLSYPAAHRDYQAQLVEIRPTN
jgi:hypothetical protein